MRRYHEKPLRVAEPVQVYLGTEDRRTLERLAEHLDLSMSDVLRKALAAYEQAILNPETHPSFQIIGIAGKARTTASEDVAIEHDRILTDAMAGEATTRKRPGATRRGR